MLAIFCNVAQLLLVVLYMCPHYLLPLQAIDAFLVYALATAAVQVR